MIEIHIPGEVIAKGRPKFSTRGGFARAYTPKKTRDYEALVATYAKKAVKIPLEGALEVDITVKKMPPKSWSKKKQRAAIEGNVLPTAKPDIDNYAKSVLDGSNGIAFKDDNQICKLTLRKVYAEEAGAVMRIKEMETE